MLSEMLSSFPPALANQTIKTPLNAFHTTFPGVTLTCKQTFRIRQTHITTCCLISPFNPADLQDAFFQDHRKILCKMVNAFIFIGTESTTVKFMFLKRLEFWFLYIQLLITSTKNVKQLQSKDEIMLAAMKENRYVNIRKYLSLASPHLQRWYYRR